MAELLCDPGPGGPVVDAALLQPVVGHLVNGDDHLKKRMYDLEAFHVAVHNVRKRPSNLRI